jgi:hypothetical protein
MKNINLGLVSWKATAAFTGVEGNCYYISWQLRIRNYASCE